jgi:6-phosphogluconolactonase
MTQLPRIYDDADALFRAAAQRVLELGREAIAARGAFHLALAGGSTPAGLYRELALEKRGGAVQWERVHIYFGDERCVPPDDAQSNYRMARETLLAHVPIPESQIYRIHGEDAPHAAAAAYDETLARALPQEEGGWRLDLILLGLGPDGHIASLFPETEILGKHKALAASVFVPKLDSWRISVTLPVINHARHIMLLVSGAAKADVVHRALNRTPGAGNLPVQRIRPRGTVEWFLDADAAGRLEQEGAP